MRTWGWVVTVAALCGLVTGAAATVAAPQGGFGLASGLAVHRATLEYASGNTQAYASAGASLVGDAQFVIDEHWSLNPYLLLSLERSDSPLDATLGNGAAGVELRRWWGSRYLGLRTGEYVELLADAGTVSTNYGIGLGAALGGEDGEGRTWGVSLDVMRLGTFPTLRAGLRLHFGWRWGHP